MQYFLEIRSYTLTRDSGTEFHRLFQEEALPLLQRWDVDVVSYGSSMHDKNSYYLMRRYDSLAHREASEEAFYSSDEWRQGPRQEILALIEHYSEVVLELDEDTIHGLRKK